MTKTMISARVDTTLKADVDAIAEAEKRSAAFVITEALEDFVRRKKWLHERIDAAVKAADESNEYVPHEEMAAWLRSWGKPNELPPPTPRKRSELT